MSQVNPQIEELVTTRHVDRQFRRSVKEAIEAPALRRRLKKMGLDFDDLCRRIDLAAISYRERILFSWDVDNLRDAANDDSALPETLRFEGDQAVLLFLDPYPGANWGHPCWIATYDIGREELRLAFSSFPPAETADARLVPVRTMAPNELANR